MKKQLYMDWKAGHMLKFYATWITLFVALLCSLGCRRPDPVPSNTLEEFKSSVLVLQDRCIDEPLVKVRETSDAFRMLAEQAAGNTEYERLCPRESAAAYRLYAAHLMMGVGQVNDSSSARDAYPWLDRAIRSNPRASDLTELKSARAYFKTLADENSGKSDPRTFIEHIIRIAMVEGTTEQVSNKVGEFMSIMRSPEMSQVSRDVDYFEEQTAIRAGIIAMHQMLQERHPGKEIGGPGPCYMDKLPNGNTCIRFKFHGNVTILLEWEVSADKNLIIPKSDSARVIMDLANRVITNSPKLNTKYRVH